MYFCVDLGAILVQLFAAPSTKANEEFTSAEKTIHIGCIRVNNVGDKKEVKKNGDFAFDNVKEINGKGFSIDLAKSAVEAGGERQVKITWKPPSGFGVTQTMQTSLMLTTKSNNTVEQWKVMLQGKISTNSSTNAKPSRLE